MSHAKGRRNPLYLSATLFVTQKFGAVGIQYVPSDMLNTTISISYPRVK